MISPLDYAKRICFSTEETLRFTYQQAVKYKDAPGCYVECGVAAGAQIIAMAHGAPFKDIHAFDSFEGIPMPSNQDDQMPGIRFLTKEEQRSLPDPGKAELVSSGATIYNLDKFCQNIIDSGLRSTNIQIHAGWFENVVPVTETGPIAILRLDGDLYNSTLVCLQHLFPRVIPGGIIIIDDIQLPGCYRAVVKYFGPSIESKLKRISNIAYLINDGTIHPDTND